MSAIFRHLAMSLDPVELALACGLVPDDWQAALLRSTARRTLVLCSRQVGKSLTAAIKTLHTAIFVAGAPVILISPSLPQSQELFGKCVDLWRRLPDAPRAEQETTTRLRFDNGSRIISLPGNEKTARSYSGASLVVMDEASRVDDELLASVRPMLAVRNAPFMALSTPAGRRGWLYEAWSHGGDEWARVSVKANECPRIGAEFLEHERSTLGELLYRQEYGLEFLDSGEAAFASELIDAAFVDEPGFFEEAAA